MGTETSKMLITFLLDRSSSMMTIKPATIEAFNGYVTQLKEDYERDGGMPIEMTLLQFDYYTGVSIDKTFFQTPIESVPLLTNQTFLPRGSTPLIDAALTTIEALEKAVEAMETKPKVVVCIQTDGEENTSRRTWSELKEKIAQKIAEGWQFNFMGAGIDAYDQGQKMGIGISNTISYNSADLGATRAAFAASAQNAGLFRTGVVADTSYSSLQKMAAGDAYDPDNKGARIQAVQSILPGAPVQSPGVISQTNPYSFGTINGAPIQNPLDLTQGLQLGTVTAVGTATRRHDVPEEKGLDLTSK